MMEHVAGSCIEMGKLHQAWRASGLRSLSMVERFFFLCDFWGV